MRLEEWRLKRRDTEEWMKHRQLPEDLKQRVRRFVQYKWLATRGVDEETILTSLPVDLRRDIQSHLCLDLVRRVCFLSPNFIGLECFFHISFLLFLIFQIQPARKIVECSHSKNVQSPMRYDKTIITAWSLNWWKDLTNPMTVFSEEGSERARFSFPNCNVCSFSSNQKKIEKSSGKKIKTHNYARMKVM